VATFTITKEEADAAYDALNAQCEHLKQCRMNARDRAEAIVVLNYPFIVLDKVRAMFRANGGKPIEVEMKP
jgi:hypothetical protein